MAKRVAKKTTNDVPPLYMTVGKNGHLVPAAEYDFTRVQSYREGTRMVVTILPDGTRPGVRNWWRIIGSACKHDLLHGLTQSQADEAVRGALDMFNPVRMANGKWIEQRMSLNDLTDAELDEKIEMLMALIVAWSGVDLDSLQKAIPHDPQEFASDINKEGFARSPAADAANNNAAADEGGADSSSPAPESGAATPSPETTQPSPSGGEPAAAEASTPNAGSGGSLDETVAELNKVFDLTHMMIAAIPDDVQPGDHGNCKCPNPRCDGTLKWSRAKSNGHVAVQCLKFLGDHKWDRGCFGPLMLSIDRNAVWPRAKQSPGDVATGQHEAKVDPSAGDGGASGATGLAATDAPALPPPTPDDLVWLKQAAKGLVAVAKEGVTRDEVIRACKPFIVSMPRGAEKRQTAVLMDHVKNHVLSVGRGDEQLDWDGVAEWARTTVAELTGG